MSEKKLDKAILNLPPLMQQCDILKDACRRLTNDMEYIEKRKAINIIRADLQEIVESK